jgi:hypothetical protein
MPSKIFKVNSICTQAVLIIFFILRRSVFLQVHRPPVAQRDRHRRLRGLPSRPEPDPDQAGVNAINHFTAVMNECL